MATTVSPLVLPPLPSLPGYTPPEQSPLEYFKLAAAQHLSKVLEIELETAYKGIESGKTSKGPIPDFSVALPRFRLKTDAKANVARFLADVSSLRFEPGRSCARMSEIFWQMLFFF